MADRNEDRDSHAGDDDTESSSRDLRDQVRRLVSKLNHSPVLNGGFSRLQEEVREVKEYQIQTQADLGFLKTAIGETKEKVSEIHDSLYDPDKGLYTRVITVERDAEQSAKSLGKLEEDTGRHSLTSKENNQRLRDLEQEVATLHKVTGDDFEDLKGLVKVKRNLNKVVWAVSLAFFAAFGKAVWDLVVHIQGALSAGGNH